MNCGPVQRLLADYSAERVSERVRGEIAAHLAVCAECRYDYEVLERTLRLVESLPAPAPPTDLWAATWERLRAAPAPGWWQHQSRRARATAVGVAMALAVGLGGGWWATHQPASTPQVVATRPVPGGAHTLDPFFQQHALVALHEPLADPVSQGLTAAMSESPAPEQTR